MNASVLYSLLLLVIRIPTMSRLFQLEAGRRSEMMSPGEPEHGWILSLRLRRHQRGGGSL